jgi:hypothetical protein
MKKFFSLLWAGWKKFALVLGIVNTKILLTITYFIIMGIAAIGSRIVRADLLDKKFRKKNSYWVEREQVVIDLESCKRQF